LCCGRLDEQNGAGLASGGGAAAGGGKGRGRNPALVDPGAHGGRAHKSGCACAGGQKEQPPVKLVARRSHGIA
jgi:hypothetical protein